MTRGKEQVLGGVLSNQCKNESYVSPLRMFDIVPFTAVFAGRPAWCTFLPSPICPPRSVATGSAERLSYRLDFRRTREQQVEFW
jgi:hypothetical protein